MLYIFTSIHILCLDFYYNFLFHVKHATLTSTFFLFASSETFYSDIFFFSSLFQANHSNMTSTSFPLFLKRNILPLHPLLFLLVSR